MIQPLSVDLRCKKEFFGKPVAIGAAVWIGGGAIICPGVTSVPRTVIGAGSVVTRDVPGDVIAVRNPCRAVREFKEQ